MRKPIQPLTTSTPCPDCGRGRLTVYFDGLVGVPVRPGQPVKVTPIPMQMVNKPFAACNACEFCAELDLTR